MNLSDYQIRCLGTLYELVDSTIDEVGGCPDWEEEIEEAMRIIADIVNEHAYKGIT